VLVNTDICNVSSLVGLYYLYYGLTNRICALHL